MKKSDIINYLNERIAYLSGDSRKSMGEPHIDVAIVRELRRVVDFVENKPKRCVGVISLTIQDFLNWRNEQHCGKFMLCGTNKTFISDVLSDIAFKLNETLKLQFTMDEPTDTVQTYIDSAREIEEVLQKGIEPVNIMDNWSAGWLSPEGEYYALNGDIANMLHNQIADALQEKGVVPMYETERDEVNGIKMNPDAWLEQHGWVRIHENNINFAGCENHRLGKKNVNMTDKQIEIIRDYITDCHQCLILAGWRRERQSIGMFTALAMGNSDVFNKKYFEY